MSQVDTVQETILTVEDLSVTFSMDRGKSRVLDNVTIDIQREEIIGIVGESGSGKSMFASALLDAVVDPGVVDGRLTYSSRNEGEVAVFDLDDSELRDFRWETISMVFQGAMSSFNPTKPIGEHFEETLSSHDHDLEEGMEHARELLTDLYLEPDRVLETYPHELSGGMRQRALIALSLVLKPEVVVMDEPTAALDLLMQRSILSLIQSLQEGYDLTVVFITHDLPLVAGLADRLAVLYAFEFVEIGKADEILNDPAHPYTRALLRAVPDLETSLTEMQPIEGSAPDPVNVPSGCSYHPRCPLSDGACRNDDPSLQAISEDHTAACFYWEEARETIEVESDRRNRREEFQQNNQSEEPVVTLNHLEVHFIPENAGLIEKWLGDPDSIRAVDDVNTEIYDNDVLAIVGESGCGKTTLGKATIGLQEPTHGTVEYRNENIWEIKQGKANADISFDDIRRSLQIIHQDPGSSLNPNYTVKSILEIVLKHHTDLSPEDREARILEMLERVGMTPPDDYAQRYPHQLSGGEKQRVALIRALLVNPDLILADEAVSALDVSLRVEMMNLFLELQDQFDTSFLMISHDLANARYLAGRAGGRIGVMYLGELIEIGPAEDVIQNPKHPYTKVLKWSTAELAPDQEIEEPPVREIDIPDPADPPSGCRFHTRCPDAREICASRSPMLGDAADGDHRAACYREYPDDHEYWDSPDTAGE